MDVGHLQAQSTLHATRNDFFCDFEGCGGYVSGVYPRHRADDLRPDREPDAEGIARHLRMRHMLNVTCGDVAFTSTGLVLAFPR